MKIVHISDIHWRGLARHEEYTNAFELLFKKIKEIKPDVIVNTGDIFHTKTQSISPEVVERMTWMFENLGNLAPNITILGNHDGNLTNLSRKDIITTIIENLESNNACKYKHHFSRNTEVHWLFDKDTGMKEPVVVHAFSPFDKEGWKNRIPSPDHMNIALFHGSVSGCTLDNGMVWSHGEIDVSDMNIYDFVLLGDIHQQQFMDYRLDKNGIRKPYMGYPGSLIQQNFGESISKGFYVWDIRAKDDWDVEFVELENLQPFYTFSWVNNVKDTIQNVLDNVPNNTILPGTRFRFITREILPQAHTEALVTLLKSTYFAQDVVFKHEKESNDGELSVEHIKNTKKNLRNDPETLINLFKSFLETQSQNITLSEAQYSKAVSIIKSYLDQYNNSNQAFESTVFNNQQWSIKSLEFGNLFRYGDKNKIVFDNHQGLIGLFGKNKIGKSSVIAAIMYALYNTTDRGSLKASDIINKRKNNCWAKITFVHDGTEYIVTRETTRSSGKDPTKSATKVNFFELKTQADGTVVQIERNSISRDETDKEIRKLIGTPEDFLMTSLASQNDIMRFINEGSTNRKKILNRFLDIDLFEKLYAFVKNDLIALNAKTKGLTLEDLNKKESELKVEIDRVIYQIENTNLLKTKKQKIFDDLQNDILSYENSNKEFLSFESRKITKKNALDSLQSELNYLENKLTVHKTGLSKLLDEEAVLARDISEINIESLKEKQKVISELSEKYNELCRDLNYEKNTELSLNKSVKKLDLVPCGDSFPNCHFIKDSHEDKIKLEAQSKLIEQMQELIDLSRKELESHKQDKIKADIAKYESLLYQLKDVKNRIDNTERVIENTSNELLYKNKHKEEIEKELNEILEFLKKNSKKTEYDKHLENQKSLEFIKNEMKQFEITLQDLYKNQGFYQANLEAVVSNRNSLIELHENYTIYSSIQEAFSKTGIPAMILKTQLPYINAELEKILMGVSDFKIILENDLSSNAMDVFLEDAHSRRIVELGSGMEKTIASLAIRVALINVGSIPRSDLFIVDEGFTALDEDNMQSCLEMINSLRNYFKSVLIISHEPAIKEIADTILEVKNDGIESKIIA